MARRKKTVSDTVDLPEPKPILKEALYKPPPSALQRGLGRLGILEEELSSFPIVTESLKDIGGPVCAMVYMRGSEDKKARELLRLWDMYPELHDTVPFEAFLMAAKLGRKQFMQLLMGEVCEQTTLEGNLLAAVSHVKVVKKTVAVALSDPVYDEHGNLIMEGGGKAATDAREMLLKHAKFLPLPKSQSLTVFGDMNQDNRKQTITMQQLASGNDVIDAAVDDFNDTNMKE